MSSLPGAAAQAHRSVLLPVLGSLIALAWLALWWLEQSPYGALFHDHGAGHAGHVGHAGAYGELQLALIYLAGWLLMIVAMMLPTTLPLIEVFRRLTRRYPNRGTLLGLLIAGYLAAWSAFGIIALALTALASPWSAAAGLWYSAALFGAAGLFQFSALKYRCLDRCRTPLGFVVERWRGDRQAYRALRIGIDHGVFCVGCCWALMMLMFAFGTASVVWMLVLALLMAIEKNAPWGRRFGRPLGVMLLITALALAASVLRSDLPGST